MHEPFVPNDCSISRQHGKVHIITGPNASGKSVFIAQAGLIAFLSHMGSFVPADAAVVGVIDAIHTRIHSVETASLQQSLFAIDLNQISTMLHNSTSASLLLIDEFGKGTEAIGGASLLGATIQHFTERGQNSPCTLVTTHALELLEQSIIQQSDNLKVWKFDVYKRDEEALTFLYKLVPGFGQLSYACEVAAMAGVRGELLDRAVEIAQSLLTKGKVEKSRRLTAQEEENDEDAQKMVDTFIAFDCEKDDLSSFKDAIAALA